MATNWWEAPPFSSLFKLWAAHPAELLKRWPINGEFTQSEVTAAAMWSSNQVAWGLRAPMHTTEQGAQSVLEVFGPDNLVPHCIVYPTEGGVQVDEFDGTSRVFPCLETALLDIAPMR